MTPLSTSEVSSSRTSVGTRTSGLYCRTFSASPNTDHGRCSNGSSYSVSAMPTRRTNGESYWPMRIIASACHAQQTRGVAVKNGDLIGDRELGSREHVIDGGLGPRVRIVGADHELARADLGGEVAQAL